MKHTRLGRTGLKVSRLCLGTMNFGPQTTEADSFAIMDHALDQGINFFDTADVYGQGKGEGITEQIVGRWFAQGEGRREKTCSSDQGPPDKEGPERWAEREIQTCRRSAEQLNDWGLTATPSKKRARYLTKLRLRPSRRRAGPRMDAKKR